MGQKQDRKDAVKAVMREMIKLYRYTMSRNWQVCAKPYTIRKKVFDEAMKQDELKKKLMHQLGTEDNIRHHFGVDQKGKIVLPMLDVKRLLEQLYNNTALPADIGINKPQQIGLPAQDQTIDEILESNNAGKIISKSDYELWPEEKEGLLIHGPDQLKDTNEPLWHYKNLSPDEPFKRLVNCVPFGLSYSGLHAFNNLMQEFETEIKDNEYFTFTLTAKHTHERLFDYMNDEKLGYYDSENYYSTVISYNVLIDETLDYFQFIKYDENKATEYTEKSITSLFTGVWRDLPEFAETVIVTYLGYIGDFAKIRVCKRCNNLFYSERTGSERGFFCPEQDYHTGCQKALHASEKTSKCRKNHNEMIKRKAEYLAALPFEIQKKFTAHKPILAVSSFCKGGNCPFGKPEPTNGKIKCPHLLEANKELLEEHELAKKAVAEINKRNKIMKKRNDYGYYRAYADPDE